MSTERTTGPDHIDGELSALLADYLAALDRGERPDRDALLGRHPHLAEQMRAFFAGQDGLDRLTAPLRAEAAPAFDLLDEIGRGGMGVVLRGRDRALDRELAVKVLLERFRDRPDLVRRFVEEARITGRLQHPFIVPVHELGALPDGRPYFAMKLIQGRTLADLLAERPAPDHDRPRFLKVFEQVCQTIAYAHSHGVIHRDLKPSNVMVGAFGEVQVMDWGLAKILAPDEPRPSGSGAGRSLTVAARPGDTLAGSVLGTLPFMPPEQACGDVARIDRRSDVFGLGAILCQVLTGRPPYTGEPAEVRDKARVGRTEEAVARLRDCGADGELVVLACRCLAADPAARPADAGAVAEAMASYFAAVQERLRAAEIARARAQAEAAAQRQQARAERRRRRATLLMAASLLLLVSGAAAFGLWYQGQQARRAAEIAARRAATVRDVTAALSEAKRLHAEGLSQADDPERWRATLRSARAALEHAEAALEHGEPTDALQAEVAAVRADLEEDDRDCAFLADLERVLQGWSAQTDKAVAARVAVTGYEAAFRAYGLDLLGRPPEESAARLRGHRFRGQLVEAVEMWARFRAAQAGRQEFVLRDGQDGMVAVTRPDWRQAGPLLAVLDAVEPDAASFRRRWRAARQDGAALARLAAAPEALAVAPLGLCNLADDLVQHMKIDDAVGLLRRGLQKHRDNYWLYAWAGFVLQIKDPPAPGEAVRYLTVAAALRSRSAFPHLYLSLALWADHDLDGAVREARIGVDLDPDYAPAHQQLGILLRDKKENGEAIRCFRRAMQLDPDSPIPCCALGQALRETGKVDEALPHLRRAVALDPKSFTSLNALGVALGEKGDPEGIDRFREALRLEPRFGFARVNLIKALLQANDLAGAERECLAAIDVLPWHPEPYYMLGDLYARQGETAKAADVYRKAAAAVPKSLDNQLAAANRLTLLADPAALTAARAALALDPRSVPAHDAVISALMRSGELVEAVRFGRDALVRFPEASALHDRLGSVYYNTRDLDGAVRCHRRAIELDQGATLPYENLGLALRQQGKLEEAADAFRKALPDPAKTGQAAQLLAETLGSLRRFDEAARSAERSLEINPGNLGAYVPLALALLEMGEFTKCLDRLREGQARLTPRDPRAETFRQLVALAERFTTLERKLPAALDGPERPTAALDLTVLGHICARGKQRRHAAAGARCFADAFDREPRLAGDVAQTNRSTAAALAVLAGTGRSLDSEALDSEARTRLRRQALAWLRADLALFGKYAGGGSWQERTFIRVALRSWADSPDLAAVRAPELLTLPTEERTAWLTFWDEVSALRQKASE
jgi:serine/threonine-protein kinase